LLEDGDDVGFIGIDAEVGHVGVGLAGGQVVVGEDVVVHVGRADGEAKIADAYAGAGGVKELVEEGVALGGIHS
jgi:hypothetical protein